MNERTVGMLVVWPVLADATMVAIHDLLLPKVQLTVTVPAAWTATTGARSRSASATSGARARSS